MHREPELPLLCTTALMGVLFLAKSKSLQGIQGILLLVPKVYRQKAKLVPAFA